MRILVVGKGGREHTYIWKIAQSPRLTKLYAAPGNPGISRYAECVDIPDTNIEALADFAERESIDLTVVGPEGPLDLGIVDLFQKRGLTVFGPTRAAAQIECDKDFALELMHKHGIPTGDYRTFTEVGPARECIREWGAPVVIKASGLAAGKGAIVCQTEEEAFTAVDEVLVQHAFGAAGDKLVLMEFLEGEEASIFAFTDGKALVYLVSSQDHKTIGEGDTGLNTGGMGAYAPAPVVTPERQKEIEDRVMAATVRALAAEGRPYVGVLYGGLIFTADGPKVIEFNCRLGDPEAQVVLPLLKTDLVDIMSAACAGDLSDLQIELDTRAATCVVMASGGYPESYDTGYPIGGIDQAEALDDVMVFHAGTGSEDGKVVTNGGRVLGITAVGEGIREAIGRAYQAAGLVTFKDSYYRRDIGHRALERL